MYISVFLLFLLKSLNGANKHTFKSVQMCFWSLEKNLQKLSYMWNMWYLTVLHMMQMFITCDAGFTAGSMSIANSSCFCLLLQHADGYSTVSGVVQGACYGAVLCVSSILCWSLVPGWVLVLQYLHAPYACGIWSYTRSTTAQKHGRNPKNGQQALPDTG